VSSKGTKESSGLIGGLVSALLRLADGGSGLWIQGARVGSRRKDTSRITIRRAVATRL
jgi:hypothetical protein